MPRKIGIVWQFPKDAICTYLKTMIVLRESLTLIHCMSAQSNFEALNRTISEYRYGNSRIRHIRRGKGRSHDAF